MIDLSRVRENPEIYKKMCADRQLSVPVDEILTLDEQRRQLQTELDQLRHDQKSAAASGDFDTAKNLKEKIRTLDETHHKTADELHQKLLDFPNFISDDTPIGRDDSENMILKKRWQPRDFDFEPRDHEDLGTTLGLIDREKAAQNTAARFVYLKSDLVLIQRAIEQLTFDTVTDADTLADIIQKNNLSVPATPFVPVIPPLMINFDTAEKMGRLRPVDDRFVFPDDRLMMIGSAEHSLGPLHADEILDADQFPLRYFASTPAFRREAGSYGRDTKGIIRQHQFDKIELVSFTTPETSIDEQNFIVAIQEFLMQKLELPYQVVAVCTGDMGKPDFRQIDIETRIPTQKKYRETHSADLMTDFQSRRLNTKFSSQNGQKNFVHMNDATAFALGRILVAILENYQNADGSITIPTALQYFCKKTKISK